MNIKFLINDCADLIQRADSSKTKTFHLCHTDDKLQCLPVNHSRAKHTIFMTFNIIDAKFGFTINLWNKLEAALVKFYIEDRRKTLITKPMLVDELASKFKESVNPPLTELQNPPRSLKNVPR